MVFRNLNGGPGDVGDGSGRVGGGQICTNLKIIVLSTESRIALFRHFFDTFNRDQNGEIRTTPRR